MSIQQTELTTGVTGAKRQSWQSSNPRELLKKIIDRDPDADLNELGNEFWASAQKNAEMLRTIVIDYWLPNNYRSLIKPREDRNSHTKIRAAKAAAFGNQIETKVEEIAKEKAKIILLDMVLPNGKKLRDTTGTECLRIAPQIGDWLARIGQIAGRSKVGTVLSEARAKALYEQ